MNSISKIISTSLITSTLVTLLIEYFAKPRLEIRKERLMHENRALREVVGHLRAVVTIAGMMTVDAPEEFDASQKRLFDEQIQAQQNRISDIAPSILRLIPEVGMTLNGTQREIISRYAGYLNGAIAAYRPPRSDFGEEIHLVSAPVLDYFDSRGRARLLKPFHKRTALKMLRGDGAGVAE